MYALTPFQKANSSFGTFNIFDLFRNYEYFDGKQNSNVFDAGDKIVTIIDIPGVEKDDIKISVEDNILKVIGVRKSEYFGEQSISKSYSIRMEKLNVENINAKLKNGELTVEIPKLEKQKLEIHIE